MTYKSSNVSSPFLNELNHLMTVKRIYQDSELDLSGLSRVLGRSKRKVSGLVQYHFDKSFPDYLNEHRLQEVLQRFNNHDHEKHTIIAIALESGFPSKSTFYRFFKKKLQISPIQFLLRENNLKH